MNMKRSRWPVVLALVSVLLVMVVAVGCGDEADAGTTVGSSAPSTEAGATEVSAPSTVDVATGDGHPSADIQAAPLTDEDTEALIYLREEEKLAHDVYTVLYEEWGTKVFDNISRSESRHMASMKTLVDSYGLADPVGANEVGVFSNEELQSLFDTLVAQGRTSETEALKVGVAIENKDIGDLERLIASTTHDDIAQVAQNLLDGSRNHLAAFSRQR